MNIASKTFIKCGFEIDLVLKQYDFLSFFNDKWINDQEGLIIGNDGQRWSCTYYTTGRLRDGFDLTVARSQKDFDRDCHAFDVHLFITVSKNGIELVDDPIIGSDYNYDDDQTPDQILENLYSEHGDGAENQISQAKEILKSLVGDL